MACWYMNKFVVKHTGSQYINTCIFFLYVYDFKLWHLLYNHSYLFEKTKIILDNLNLISKYGLEIQVSKEKIFEWNSLERNYKFIINYINYINYVFN